MAHIWNSADLTKPLSIAKPWIHQLSLVQELILGRPQVAPKSPPGRPQFDCHCNEIWIHCLKEISDRNTVAIKLGANWGQTGGKLGAT